MPANGRAIRFSDYGDRNSEFGWEFDHYPIPASLGGSDDIFNLRPLHCTTNASLGGLLGAETGLSRPPLGGIQSCSGRRPNRTGQR